MDEEENNKNYKPVFDGRLKFYEVMKHWLITFGQAQQNNDIGNIIRCVEGMLFMVSPFIKTDHAEQIADQIDKCRDLHVATIKNKGLQFYLEKELFKLKKMIFIHSKHMWLPTGREDEHELDMERFFRESDL